MPNFAKAKVDVLQKLHRSFPFSTHRRSQPVNLIHIFPPPTTQTLTLLAPPRPTVRAADLDSDRLTWRRGPRQWPSDLVARTRARQRSLIRHAGPHLLPHGGADLDSGRLTWWRGPERGSVHRSATLDRTFCRAAARPLCHAGVHRLPWRADLYRAIEQLVGTSPIARIYCLYFRALGLFPCP